MRQVMERQEAMQQKLLEMIEKRGARLDDLGGGLVAAGVGRLTREHKAMAQEHEIASSKDATIIAFLQNLTTGGSRADPPHRRTYVSCGGPAVVPATASTLLF